VDIRINDTPVDFTLEGERTLGEVLGAVRLWLQKTAFTMTGLQVDGREVDVDSPLGEIENTDIGDIERVSVTARHQHEAAFERLSVLEEYVDAVRAALAEGAEPKADLVDTADEAGLLARMLLDGPGDAPSGWGARLSELVKSRPGDSEDTQAWLESLLAVVRDRKREYALPGQEFRRVCRMLGELVAELERVPVQLQTGDDRDAMATVSRFAELTQKLVRVYALMPLRPDVETGIPAIANKAFPEFLQDFHSTLVELAEAMSDGDSVLTGDLLEYEVAPRIQDLLEAVDSEPEAGDAR
jgi:hypothetical protein